jgi:hypothetical protein
MKKMTVFPSPDLHFATSIVIEDALNRPIQQPDVNVSLFPFCRAAAPD